MLLGMWCEPWGDHVQGQELGFNDLCGFFSVTFYEIGRDAAQASLLADSIGFCFFLESFSHCNIYMFSNVKCKGITVHLF